VANQPATGRVTLLTTIRTADTLWSLSSSEQQATPATGLDPSRTDQIQLIQATAVSGPNGTFVPLTSYRGTQMAISFYYVDTMHLSTDRRSSTVEALKARRVPRRRSDPAAAKPVTTATVLRAVVTGCAMLVLGAFAASFVPF